MTRFAVAVLTCFLLASTAFAGAQPVLTAEGALYLLERSDERVLTITKRIGSERSVLTVPSTDDFAKESEVSMHYDHAAGVLYVTWVRSDDRGDEIRFATLTKDGVWSHAKIITAAGESVTLGGLHTLLTRVKTDDVTTTLLHATWWRQSSQSAIAYYGVAAFEQGINVSTEMASLRELAATRVSVGDEREDTGKAQFPPMAIAIDGSEIDVVFGDTFSTALTRVRVQPKLGGNARIWKPVGRRPGVMPKAKITSATEAPVQAFISGERVVLYTPNTEHFRYVVYNNAQWSPIRTIALEGVTIEELVSQLRKLVENELPVSEGGVEQ